MAAAGLLILLAIFVAGLVIGATCGGFVVFLILRKNNPPRGFDVIQTK
jgi:hypothetical protein